MTVPGTAAPPGDRFRAGRGGGRVRSRWRPRRLGDRPDERGQATVELALLIPVLVVCMLGIVQIAVIMRMHVLVGHAAREAVRVAAVDSDPAAPRRAALETTPLDPDRLDVDVVRRGDPGDLVRVELSYRVPTEVPLVGGVMSDLILDADATMRVE